jgi:hypothetical protein
MPGVPGTRDLYEQQRQELIALVQETRALAQVHSE